MAALCELSAEIVRSKCCKVNDYLSNVVYHDSLQ
jgi:hypothetical protein